MAQIIGLNKVNAFFRAKAAKAGIDGKASVIVGYSAGYSLAVHENLNAHHRVGQAKYLEQPARTHEKEIALIVRTAYQAGATLLQALFLGGLRLQRESQLLVPVDTGQLRNSAFTRKEP